MDKHPDSDTITIKRSTVLSTYYFVGAVVLLLFSCPLLLYGRLFPLILFLFMFVLLFVLGLMSWKDRQPKIIITNQYIDVIGIVQIPLNLIKSVDYEYRHRGFSILIFHLQDENAKPIDIQVQHLDRSPSQLRDLIRKRMENLAKSQP